MCEGLGEWGDWGDQGDWGDWGEQGEQGDWGEWVVTQLRKDFCYESFQMILNIFHEFRNFMNTCS